MKLMWFLCPRGSEEGFAEWRSLGTGIAIPGAARWLRSVGATRSTSFLADAPVAAGTPVLLEEFWIDRAHAEQVRAFLLDRSQGLAAALEPLADLSASHLVMTDEAAVIDGPREAGAGRTTMALYVRRADQTREASQRRWMTGHADMVRRHGIITHYTQCPIIDADCPFDGIPIIHFGNEAAEAEFLAASTVVAEQLADSKEFIDHAKTLRFSFAGDQHEGAV